MISPKISVIIPSLNKGKYIDKTLSSIFLQKYPNLEVIIQDGGSTDQSLEIIKRYARRYPKIIKFVSKNDAGQLDAINRGLKKASGDITTYINADDVYEKNTFKSVCSGYLGNKNAYWFVGRGVVIDDKGKEIVKTVTYYKNFLLSLNSRFCLLVTNYFMQPSIFITKKAFQKFGPFIGTKDFVTEYDLWLKISGSGMPIVINKVLSRFRIEKDTKTKKMSKKLLEEDENIVRRYTDNSLILVLHKLHNIGRILFGNIV